MGRSSYALCQKQTLSGTKPRGFSPTPMRLPRLLSSAACLTQARRLPALDGAYDLPAGDPVGGVSKPSAFSSQCSAASMGSSDRVCDGLGWRSSRLVTSNGFIDS
jgi:hypothetical protein